MTNEEKTISILKQAGQIKPDYNRFADFISQMNVTVPPPAGQADIGRNLQAEYGRIPSFWTLGSTLGGVLALIIVIAFAAYFSPVNNKSMVKFIDQTVMAYQDNALYDEFYISYDDASLVATLEDPELESFDQILNYEI